MRADGKGGFCLGGGMRDTEKGHLTGESQRHGTVTILQLFCLVGREARGKGGS